MTSEAMKAIEEIERLADAAKRTKIPHLGYSTDALAALGRSMLDHLPTIKAMMNEMVGGPALVEAQAEIERLTAALQAREVSGDAADYETVRRTMAVFNGFDGPSCRTLWWRTDGEYAPITLLVNCNDLFFWGCADAETITPANVANLEKAHAAAKAVGAVSDCDTLFVCRERAMRPQGAMYPYMLIRFEHTASRG